jgi:hypothetical protein
MIGDFRCPQLRKSEPANQIDAPGHKRNHCNAAFRFLLDCALLIGHLISDGSQVGRRLDVECAGRFAALAITSAVA